ncbi:MAG: hypothetical protein JNL79_32720 [Myxococcales bacterium]|nr:hypothetical protein [Myxococcales bacterium]
MMRRKLLTGALAAGFVGCVSAETDADLGTRARVDSAVGGDTSVKDSSVGDAKDTGATPDSGTAKDSTITDSGVDPDTGTDPDTGDPDTGSDPDTGTVLDTGTVGGACTYCSSGTCKLPLEDYSCLLNCLLDGWFDCSYTSGASTPCTCLP